MDPRLFHGLKTLTIRGEPSQSGGTRASLSILGDAPKHGVHIAATPNLLQLTLKQNGLRSLLQNSPQRPQRAIRSAAQSTLGDPPRSEVVPPGGARLSQIYGPTEVSILGKPHEPSLLPPGQTPPGVIRPGWTQAQIEKLLPRKVAVRLHLGETLLGVALLQMLSFHVIVQDVTTGGVRVETFSGFLQTTKLLLLAHVFELGHRYTITIVVKKPTTNYAHQHPILMKHTLSYKEFLRRSELQILLDKAKQYSSTHGILPVVFAYRSKPEEYFNQILSAKEKVMRVYPKSNNGDPGCPINREVNGLFFSVRPDPDTYNLPIKSPFGNNQMFLPIQKLIGPDVNL